MVTLITGNSNHNDNNNSTPSHESRSNDLSSIAKQFLKSIESDLTKVAPKKLLRLQALLNKIINTPDQVVIDDIRQTHKYLNQLGANKYCLLKEFYPEPSEKIKERIANAYGFFRGYAEAQHDAQFVENELKQHIKSDPEITKALTKLLATVNEIIDKNQGSLTNIVSRLQNTANDIVQKSMTAVMEKAEKVIERTEKAVDKTLARVEKSPAQMVRNLVNLAPLPNALPNAQMANVELQPAELPDAPAPAPGGEGTISQFLSYGASLLEQMLQGGAEAVSNKSLSVFSQAIALGLKQVLSKMGNDEAFSHPRNILSGIINHLEHMQPIPNNLSEEQLAQARANDPDAFDAETGLPVSPWQALKNRLSRAAEASSMVKIYVNGFFVPISGGRQPGVVELDDDFMDDAVDEAFVQNISQLKEARTPTTVAAPSQDVDWKTLTEQEKNKFIFNTTQYLTLKHIYENVCHLTPDTDQFYLELIQKSKESRLNRELTQEEASENLKKLLFAKLSDEKVGFFKVLIAKLQYSVIYGFFIRKYVTKASTIYFNEIFEYIKKQKKDDFDILRNQLTKNFTRYLGILGDAYETVAKSEIDGLQDEMLREQLEKPKSNLHFKTQELYLEFAQDVIKKTLGSGLMGWIAKKIIGNPENIARAIVDKATGALQDHNGYTHALNCVIHEQLEEIWKELQRQQTENDPAAASNPALSETRKDELTALVKHLFEILSKSKSHTFTELRDVISGKSTSANINKAIDDLFIEDVIEKITSILAVTIQSLLKEDQLLKLTYNFANLANRSFEVGALPTKSDMKDKERDISKLCRQILQKSVVTAVREQLDFSGKKQQSESNHYIQEMRKFFLGDPNYISIDETPELFAGLYGNLNLINELANPGIDRASQEAKAKINAILDATLAYQKDCASEKTRAWHSKMNDDNKNEIARRYLKIDELSKPLVQSVAQMKKHLNTLECLHQATPKLRDISSIIHALPPLITNRDFTNCDNRMLTLTSHLKELKKLDSTLANQLSTEVDKIAFVILAIKKAIQTQTYCNALYSQQPSLLTQIATEKKQHLAALFMPAALKNKIATLKQELRTNFKESFSAQLLEKLQVIEKAVSAEEVDNASRDILNLARNAFEQARTDIQNAAGQFRPVATEIVRLINDSNYLAPNVEQISRNGIGDELAETTRHLESLKTWINDNTKELPFINFALNMKSVQKFATGLVYRRVRERVDGLIKLLRKEETYRYGVLNHLLLIPYVQALRAAPKEIKGVPAA